MSQSDAEKWNARYSERRPSDTEPIPFLADHIHLLGSGKALVLAAGCGRNAVYLAHCGFSVTALDISAVGLERCRQLAASGGVALDTLCADLDDFELGTQEYDLITMIYFYEPRLFPSIRAALKPGGHFLFQTFSRKHAEIGTFGPKNPAYLATRGAVLKRFQADTIVVCEEAALTEDGDTEAVLQLIVRIA